MDLKPLHHIRKTCKLWNYWGHVVVPWGTCSCSCGLLGMIGHVHHDNTTTRAVPPTMERNHSRTSYLPPNTNKKQGTMIYLCACLTSLSSSIYKEILHEVPRSSSRKRGTHQQTPQQKSSTPHCAQILLWRRGSAMETQWWSSRRSLQSQATSSPHTQGPSLPVMLVIASRTVVGGEYLTVRRRGSATETLDTPSTDSPDRLCPSHFLPSPTPTRRLLSRICSSCSLIGKSHAALSER